jgi:hypothetical protein
MRVFWFVVGIVVAAPVCGQPVDSMAVAAVVKAEKARTDARHAGDLTTWASYLTEDFMLVGPMGQATSKAERLASLKATPAGTPSTVSNERFRTYADTILRTYHLDDRTYMSEVWVKQQGKWLLAHAAFTPFVTNKP